MRSKINVVEEHGVGDAGRARSNKAVDNTVYIVWSGFRLVSLCLWKLETIVMVIRIRTVNVCRIIRNL